VLDSSSSKKQGHEMHGVLLTLLFYMLLTESAKKLTDRMGQKTLSEYVKIFDLTLG